MGYNRCGEFIRNGKEGFDPDWKAPKKSSEQLKNNGSKLPEKMKSPKSADDQVNSNPKEEIFKTL